MKKSILIISMLIIVSMSFSQEDNKEKYKDYKACTECFDKWDKSSYRSDYNNNSSNPMSGTNKAPRNRETGILAQELRRNIAMVFGVFLTTVSAVIYIKSTKAAGAIQ